MIQTVGKPSAKPPKAGLTGNAMDISAESVPPVDGPEYEGRAYA
jgi:hypothetical protein